MEKRNMFLRAAVAAALGTLATGAYAAKVDQTNVITVAKEYIKDATSTVTLPKTVAFQVEGTDIFIGRAQPFNVKISLASGTFGAIALTAASTTCLFDTLGGNSVWTLLAGGAGSNFATYNVAPDSAGGAGLKANCTFAMDTTTTFGSAAAGTTLGGGTDLSATVQFSDPTTGTVLGTATGTVMKSGTGVKATIAATPTSGEKIDLTQSGLFFSGATKDVSTQLGSVKIEHVAGVYAASGVSLTSALINSDFKKEVALSGTFTAFEQLVPTTTGAYAGVALWDDSGAGAVAKTFDTASATGTSVKFIDTAGANALSAGTSFGVLFTVPTANSVVIEETTPAVTVTLTNAATSKTAVTTGSLAALLKNGWSTNLYFFNPTADESSGYKSYLRVTNTSGLDGALSVTITLDDGTSGSGQLAATLAKGKTQLFTVANIETATGKTIPTGTKARITLNGVFSTGAAMGFMLNPDGTLTNMSHAQ